MQAIRKRDIIAAKILTKEERNKLNIPRGGNDVLIKSLCGYKSLISRGELIKRYRHLDGRRIKLAGWRSGVLYIVGREDNTQASVFFISNKYNITFRGKSLLNYAGRYYLVFLDNGSGQIDKNKPYLIKKDIFRKLFIILDNDIIDKYKNSDIRKTIPKSINNIKSSVNKNNTTKDNNLSINNKVNNDNKLDKEQVNSNINTGRNYNGTNLKNIDNSQHTYKAIGKIIDDKGKVIGFVIEGNGRVMKVSKKEMLKLCEMGKVSNIIVVTKEGGGKYLRGNGIRISDLDEYRV